MIEIMGLRDLAEELGTSEVGHYADSYNYVLFLKKQPDGSLKSYQMCVQGRDEDRDMYVSEFDLFSEEVEETWDLEEFDGYSENEDVYIIGEIEEI